MPCLTHIFTHGELKKLNAHQLHILDEAIIRELQTSAKVRNAVRQMLKRKGGLYTQMTAMAPTRAKKRRKRAKKGRKQG
jgi:ribosomal protein L16/L10AE